MADDAHQQQRHAQSTNNHDWLVQNLVAQNPGRKAEQERSYQLQHLLMHQVNAKRLGPNIHNLRGKWQLELVYRQHSQHEQSSIDVGCVSREEVNPRLPRHRQQNFKLHQRKQVENDRAHHQLVLVPHKKRFEIANVKAKLL